MRPPVTASLACLTADLPGIAGVIKQRVEDFLVEEVPVYQPCGKGEHLYLFIEKADATTTQAVRRLSKIFNVPRSEIGYAGLKDKRAVTRQHFSFRMPDPSRDAELVARIAHTPMKVLWAARHTNKLRRGHLAGNRFVIRIRNVDPAQVVRAKRILDRLVSAGVPNFLGEQRFGIRQNNHEIGLRLLQGKHQEVLDLMLGGAGPGESDSLQAGRAAYDRGDFESALQCWPRSLHADRHALDLLRQKRTAQDTVLRIEPAQRQFFLNALQSAIFNQVLDRRIRDGLFPQLVEGDLAFRHDNGAVFLADRAAVETDNAPTGRVPALVVSPSGPMWGRNMPMTQGAPHQLELEALGSFGIDASAFSANPEASIEGARRALRVPLLDADISAGADEHGPYIQLAFQLPRGSFATVLLREIMKSSDPYTAPDDEETT